MKLSFVVPAHNEENYIGDCLTSILAQKAGAPCDIEVIVVDNASTDRTAEIARQYPGVIIVHEPQKGLVRARGAGFLTSTGDIIANIDADTRLTPGWIAKVVAAFSKDKNLVALSGPFVYYDAPRKVRFFTHVFYWFGFCFYLVNRFVLRVGSMLQGGNFIVRRSALNQIGGIDAYDTSISLNGEDADMARRLHKVGKVRFTFSLPAHSSGRRLAKEGGLATALRYGINYVGVIFTGKPFTGNYQDIRFNQKNATYQPENMRKEWVIGICAAIILAALLAGTGYVLYHAVIFARAISQK